MRKTFIVMLLAAMTNCMAAETEDVSLNSDEIMATAEKVAGYFIRTNPDVGADSYVGGKTRNSRIWTRGVFYEGLLNMEREQHHEDWLKYSVDWGDFHNWYSCTDSQKRHANK